MKEEGEITDDDDKQVMDISEMVVPEKRQQRRVFSRKRKRTSDPDRRLVSSQSNLQRSEKSFDHGSANSRNPTAPPLMELSVSAIRNAKPDFTPRPDSHTSMPHLASNFTYFRPALVPPLLHPRPRFSCLSQSEQNNSGYCDFWDSSWYRSSNPQSQTSSSYTVRNSNDTEVITVSDSDTDIEVLVSTMNQDDQDLDELQLRRDALDSAVKSNKIKKKIFTSSSKDSISLSNSEFLHSDRIHLDSNSNTDLISGSSSVQSSVGRNVLANDGDVVSEVVIPVPTSSNPWSDQLTADNSHISSEYTVAVLSQQSDVVLSNSVLNAEVGLQALTESTYVKSSTTINPALSVYQEVQQELDIDNYEEVEMELDSGSDSGLSESRLVNDEHEPTEWTSNTVHIDHSLTENQCNSSTPVSSESSATKFTYSIEPLLKPLSNFSDSTACQSSVSCPDASDKNVAVDQPSEGSVVCTVYDDKLPVLLHTNTEVVDSCNFKNRQQQRKAKDADKKSELLLRAAVLESLSSKRQQQQQSQLDTVSCVPQDRPKATKQQVRTHSTKRIVTPSLTNQLTTQLPVQQPLVISLTGESSDSDDAVQLELADSCGHSSTAVTSSSVAISSNVDRFLREIRRESEGPKTQDCDIAPSHQVVSSGTLHSTQSLTAVKCLEKHSSSESALANQPMLSSNVCTSLPFLTHETLLMKNSLANCNKGMRDSVQLDTKDTHSVQKSALCNVERQISCERRKLQLQKIALSKTKLKMARKKEQIDTAEKRIKKLREQLVAAEKIAVSSKKQLANLHEETLTVSHGIKQHQKAICRLEVGLRIAQKNLVSSTNENGCESKNIPPSAISFANSQPPATKVSCKWSGNTVEGSASSRVSSAAINGQDSDKCITTADVPDPSFSISQAPQSSLDTELCDKKQTQMDDSTLMTRETLMSIRQKRLRHLNAIRACKSESGTTLVKGRSVKREAKAKGTEIERSQTAELQIVSRAVNASFPDVSGERSVDLCPLIKPCISVNKSDSQTQQKTGRTSSDDLSVASDNIGNSDICSATLGEFTMPSDKKIKQILHHYNISLDKNSSTCSLGPSCRLFVSDPVFSFKFPVNATASVTASFSAAHSNSDASTIGDSYKPYHSSLQCFRSYRFTDFYRQKGLSVTAETFSHKLDCRVPLCKFDLMGKCLDENCSWQHWSDYSLGKKEHLVDIVSYCPSVVGIDNSTPLSKYEQLMNQYTENFFLDTCTQMSHLEQCLCLIDRVKSAAGLVRPHAVCTSARCWKLHRNKQCLSAGDRNDSLFSPDDVCEGVHESASGCLATDDVRYWMVADTDQMRNLEEAVTENPSDDSLWIKLAYAKMMEMKGCVSHDEYISYGLNILSRAVEANPSNSTLWRHYLDLYMVTSHADKDVSSLYEQAIQYAPSYEFFWKYLQMPVSYSQKMDICKRLRQYLCSPMCHDDSNTRSHHLLETVLYQAALCTMSGRFKDGLQVIQAIVQSKASVIWLTLTSCDRIVMWLSFIHLYECRQLPKALFDPANSNPGPVVRKEPFVVPFQMGTKTRISYETLLQLFESAFSACDKNMKPASDSVDEYPLWLAALRGSRILLELSCHGQIAAQQHCQQLLQLHPYLVDVWMILIQLMVASSDNTTEGSGSIPSTVEKAVASNPQSVTLFLAGVCALIECRETDGALSIAELCPISLFEVEKLDAASLDPNLLYCCLLGQPVPPTYKVPTLRSSVPRQYLVEQQANLWLIYCLLLDLQGAHDQATETYHLALSCLTRTKDIQRLWLAFLRRTAAVISHQLPWLSPASSVDEKRKLWRQFESDVDRALLSLPVRRRLPHSTQTYDDYTSHNEIIQLYVSCLSDVDIIQELYEKYMRQMPGNVELALASVNSLLNREAVQLGHGLCLVALHSCPRAASLWNISLRLNQRAAADVGLMRCLYTKTTKMFPFSANLWKTYIMFEVINKSREHMQEVLEKCSRLQVNIAGFIDSLLK